jgi:hypothetical protein
MRRRGTLVRQVRSKHPSHLGVERGPRRQAFLQAITSKKNGSHEVLNDGFTLISLKPSKGEKTGRYQYRAGRRFLQTSCF